VASGQGSGIVAWCPLDGAVPFPAFRGQCRHGFQDMWSQALHDHYGRLCLRPRSSLIGLALEQLAELPAGDRGLLVGGCPTWPGVPGADPRTPADGSRIQQTVNPAHQGPPPLFAASFAAASLVPGFGGAVVFVILSTVSEMMFMPSGDVLIVGLIREQNRAVGYSIFAVSTALGEALARRCSTRE
jgi:hypothetical protein